MTTLFRFDELSPTVQRYVLDHVTWPYNLLFYKDGREFGPDPDAHLKLRTPRRVFARPARVASAHRED